MTCPECGGLMRLIPGRRETFDEPGHDPFYECDDCCHTEPEED